MPIDVDTGGQSNDCAVFNSPAANQFRIANPKSKTYSTSVNGAPVTFTVKLNPDSATGLPAYANQKYMDVSSTGAAIVDIGIKGGNDETDYRYSGLPPGYITADGALHAPAQATLADGTPTTLYSISNLTFCFDVRGSVSGTVYHDVNESGTNDDNSPQSGWTVHLYQGTTLVKTTTSGSGGSYAFALQLATGSQYTVCEVPPSGSWAQTQPSPSGTNVCSAAGELVKGYRFTPTSATQQITGNDFGNVTSQLCVPGPFGEPGYMIQLAGCKPGQSYVFNSGTTPAGKPFVSVWGGDQTNTTEEPMVEKITWPYDASLGQNKFTLQYTDVFPFDLTNAQDDAVLQARSAGWVGIHPAIAVPDERNEGRHPSGHRNVLSDLDDRVRERDIRRVRLLGHRRAPNDAALVHSGLPRISARRTVSRRSSLLGSEPAPRASSRRARRASSCS